MPPSELPHPQPKEKKNNSIYSKPHSQQNKQMGKKMKLPFLFKTTEEGTTTSWPWPSCGTTPKTLSFRAGGGKLSFAGGAADVSPEKPRFTAGLDSEESGGGGESIEAVIRGLRSTERLFFEPGETSSIMEEAKTSDGFPFKESVVMAMESQDPYVDFKRSMEEMVEAHGLKDWECLEELLSWFLRVNGKNNHGYIIEAFVDLLFALAFASSLSSLSSSSSPSCSDEHDRSSSNAITSTAHSPTSPLSFSSSSTSSTTPCSSSLEAEVLIEKSVDN